MRSSTPFFEDYLTAEIIEKAATVDGRLLFYCGAGVTIDRTGHSWGGLIVSLIPQERSADAPGMPARAEVAALTQNSPETLASSVVYLLREAAGGGAKLRKALSAQLRNALYKTQAQWQESSLVLQIMTLAILRFGEGRSTALLTTNYDTFLEASFSDSVRLIPKHIAMPGLRVFLAGNPTPVRIIPPHKVNADHPAAYIDITYLHGRLPPDSTFGKANWPLVLDENSYAASASKVESTIQESLEEASFAVMLGTSLRDTPLIRALSATSRQGCERVAVLLRADYAHPDDKTEQLAVTLAQHRASELGVTTLFPDFPAQVGQLINEAVLRIAYPMFRADEPLSFRYAKRVDAWWDSWLDEHAEDHDLNDELRKMLIHAHEITGTKPAASLMETGTERLQVELWIREAPVATLRNLRRWGRATDAFPDGRAGKNAPLDRGSYLAPVQAFVEGRPLLLGVETLDRGRHELAQYTWKSFLCVPIRANHAIVAVVCLASDRPLSECAMKRDKKMTTDLVSRLRLEATELIEV